jgi:DNA-directed RNA polymerase sigma subunit (sigma70/sigma32)
LLIKKEKTPQNFTKKLGGLMRNSDKDLLKNLLLKTELRDQEFVILVKRYGLDDKEPLKVFQIGKLMNLSDKEIRRLSRVALMKIRQTIQDPEELIEYDFLLQQLTLMRVYNES